MRMGTLHTCTDKFKTFYVEHKRDLIFDQQHLYF